MTGAGISAPPLGEGLAGNPCRSGPEAAKMLVEPPMKIQEESPLPMSPLEGLEDDYGHAVLHIAWDRHSETKELTLLFAFVELLPTEIPPPIDDYDFKAPRSSYRLGSDSKHCIYVRHAVMTAREGLDWYLACRVGTAILPGKNRSPLKLADLGEEPPWPTLISASDDSDAIPFVPQWIRCPRTHHLLPLVDFDLKQLWSAEEKERAQRWIEDRMHFALGEYPEYWGSVHLIAPNPVYREMHTRLQQQQPAESVLMRFQPRAKMSVNGLELIFREKDPWGVTASRHLTLKSSSTRINFSREVNAVMDDIWDPQRGFLTISSSANPFLKTIQLSMGILRQVAVHVQGRSYEVTRSDGPEYSKTIGSHKVAAARSRMLGAYFSRQERHTAESQDQQWFKDQKEEARKLLRSLLTKAHREVLLVDPYFGAEDLSELLSVGRTDIPVRILGSTQFLKKALKEGRHHTNGEQLLGALMQLRSHLHMNPFEIRVMLGAGIHDRFLAVDKRIWLLGSSINQFGARGTMMIALPDPDAVRDDLLKEWNDSVPLETWLERPIQSHPKIEKEADESS